MYWTLDYLQAAIDAIGMTYQRPVLTLSCSYPTRRTILKMLDFEQRSASLDPESNVKILPVRDMADDVIRMKTVDGDYEVKRPTLNWKKL
jgi:hypothetical protein